jgi:hypothetical protein
MGLVLPVSGQHQRRFNLSRICSSTPSASALSMLASKSKDRDVRGRSWLVRYACAERGRGLQEVNGGTGGVATDQLQRGSGRDVKVVALRGADGPHRQPAL